MNWMIRKEITIEVSFYRAPDFFSRDVALLKLRIGYGDKNNSKYTEEEFVKEIKDGNLVVAMLREDPIGYAIVKDNKIAESYVGWGFRDSTLEEDLREASLSERLN